MKLNIENAWKQMVSRLSRADALGPLLARLSVGAVFYQSGLGKLTHLERTTAFFTELGLVAPAFHARFVGGLELVGGTCLVLGLATRLFSVPLAFTMVVAVLTAQLSEIDGPVSLLALSEVTIFAVLVWLVLRGAGALSLDRIIQKRVGASRPAQATEARVFVDAS